jgi:hypothetical protein
MIGILYMIFGGFAGIVGLTMSADILAGPIKEHQGYDMCKEGIKALTFM